MDDNADQLAKQLTSDRLTNLEHCVSVIISSQSDLLKMLIVSDSLDRKTKHDIFQLVTLIEETVNMFHSAIDVLVPEEPVEPVIVNASNTTKH